MLNNFKYLFIAFIAALLLTMVGVLLQFYRVPGGQFLISTMLMAQAAALIWMIVLLVKNRR